MFYRLTVPIGAALLIALTGCGSNGNDSGSQATQDAAQSARTETAQTAKASETMSHAEVVSRLNALCTEGNAKANRIEQSFTDAANAGDDQKAAEVYAQVLPIYDDGIKAAEAINPPPEDTDALSRYLQSLKRSRGVGERIVTALKESNSDAMDVLNESLDRETQKRIAAAIDLGAEKCGQT